MKTFLKILFLNIVLFGYTNAQWDGRITIASSINTHFIVTNPQGYKTGYDPRGKTDYSHSDVKEDIPESDYGVSGIGSLSGNHDIWDIECDMTLSSTDEAGKYHLLLIGAKLDSFWVDVWCSKRINGVIKDREKFLIEGVLDCDSTLSYDFTFPSDDKPYSLYKNVTINSLKQDINAMQKLGWIPSQTTAQNYCQLYSTVGTQIADSNIFGARTTLDSILNKLHTDSATAISGDACKLLSADTRQLLKQLPNISQCTVKLLSSTGSLLAGGSLQYKDSTWENATNNNDGTFTIISSKKKLSLRMTYAYGTQTKSNVTIGSDTIVFQTKNVSVNLQNSYGNPLDTGIVQYNASGWQDFGTTSNGVVTKELLPIKYNFRLTYNGTTISEAQNIDSNATIVFQTVLAKVLLQTSTGAPLDTGVVQFNAGGWKTFGTTLNGAVTKELLPTKYNFRMTYDGATISKAQSIDSNATVIFQTVKTLVQFNNSKGNPIDTGIVQFNSGGWKDYGSTSNGVVSKELLPVKYTFRLTYNGSSVSTAQNVDSNATVVFSTVLCTVSVTNSSGNPLNNATVSYNASGWKVIGTTTNGIITKEFLPVKIQFRAAYGTKQQSVTQDVSVNPLIQIVLPVQ